MLSALADLAAQLSTDAVKAIVPRVRPHVHRLVGEPHTGSFPSGHAASSFACAIVLASFLPRLRVPLLVLAALVAFSRAYVGVHYPLDVLAGAALGVLLGSAIRAPAVSRAAAAWSARRARRGRTASR